MPNEAIGTSGDDFVVAFLLNFHNTRKVSVFFQDQEDYYQAEDYADKTNYLESKWHTGPLITNSFETGEKEKGEVGRNRHEGNNFIPFLHILFHKGHSIF